MSQEVNLFVFDHVAELVPFVRFLVETVIKENSVGLCAGTIRINDAKRGMGELCDEPCADRFKIEIPYGGQYITWEVIFNAASPKMPPDFIFHSDDQDFLPDIDNLKSLDSWDVRDSQSLLLVLREILQEYKAYHLTLLHHSRLQYEYETLVSSTPGYTPNDVEVYVTRRNGTPCGPVYFLIRVKVDVSTIPDYLNKPAETNPGEEMAMLLVTYQNLDGGKVSPQLVLSPRLEYILSEYPNRKFVPFPREGCLFDYVPIIKDHLTDMIDRVVGSYEKRKEYISAFIEQFGSAVQEYDTSGFNKITFLLESRDFRFIFTISLTNNFPTDQPVFVFQSIYSITNDGSPVIRKEKTYPYSPRWSYTEMAHRARIYIMNSVPALQKDLVTWT